eukprot:1503129-Pyramimonas_sp.AAC.1
MEDIMQETRNFDLVLLGGTRQRTHSGNPVMTTRTAGRWVLEAPTSTAQHANSSCGCAIGLGPAVEQNSIVQTWPSPPTAPGRALGVRVKYSNVDVCALVVYYPPQPQKRAQRAHYFKTVDILTK